MQINGAQNNQVHNSLQTSCIQPPVTAQVGLINTESNSPESRISTWQPARLPEPALFVLLQHRNLWGYWPSFHFSLSRWQWNTNSKEDTCWLAAQAAASSHHSWSFSFPTATSHRRSEQAKDGWVTDLGVKFRAAPFACTSKEPRGSVIPAQVQQGRTAQWQHRGDWQIAAPQTGQHPQGPQHPTARLGGTEGFYSLCGCHSFRLPWSETLQTPFSAGMKCNPMILLFIALTQ